MLIVHRGMGMLAPGFGILFALLFNVLTDKIFGSTYFQDHKWPKLGVLVMSGLACLVTGIWLKKKRANEAHLEQQAIDALHPKFAGANAALYSGPHDHLMFIPLRYWSIVYFAAAIIYLAVSGLQQPSATAEKRTSSQSYVSRYEEDKRIAGKIKDVVLAYSTDGRGAHNSIEAIAAMAAVVGERCLDAADEVPVRTHDMMPGQRVFSDKINFLLMGDQTLDIEAIPAQSIFGTLRDELAGTRFEHHLPQIEAVFEGYAGRLGDPGDWGKVPLSLPSKYHPEKLPLRVAFDTRQSVDQAMGEDISDKTRRLRLCVLALVMMLKDDGLAEQLQPAVAMTLTFEMVNGMAKTIPMSNQAIDKPTRKMREAQHEILKIEPRHNSK